MGKLGGKEEIIAIFKGYYHLLKNSQDNLLNNFGNNNK